MIIWSGWGFLVAVFVLVASLAMELVTESLTHDDNFYQTQAWPLALALVIAGIATWFVGIYLNARGARTVIDKATGKELALGSRHHFFFIPMHYWGPALIVLAALSFALRL
jgi:hypothetical protein